MAETKPAKKGSTQKTAQTVAATGSKSKGSTDEERAAMRERSRRQVRMHYTID
jgi:hypothetical protein